MKKIEMTEHGKNFGSPLKAIKMHCVSCIGGNVRQIETCDDTECCLFAYRFGKNPFSKRQLTDEQREAASKRFKKMWADKKAPEEKPAKKRTTKAKA